MVDGRTDTAKWVRDIILTVVVFPAFLLWLGMTPPQVIVAGLCALALVKAWEHGRLAVTVGALLLMGTALGWDWYYYKTFLVLQASQTQATPTRAVPKPTPESPKLAPWVLPEEIETQQKLGRILLPYTARELLQMWTSGRNVGAYFGKWIKIDYLLKDLNLETIDKKPLYLTKMDADYGHVHAYFDVKKWEPNLMQMRVNVNQIKALCQLNRIDEVEVAKNWPKVPILVADHCDLL